MLELLIGICVGNMLSGKSSVAKQHTAQCPRWIEASFIEQVKRDQASAQALSEQMAVLNIKLAPSAFAPTALTALDQAPPPDQHQ